MRRFQRITKRVFCSLQTPPKSTSSVQTTGAKGTMSEGSRPAGSVTERTSFANQVSSAEPVSPLAGNTKIDKGGPKGPNFEFTLAQAGIVFASGMAILGIVKMGEIAMQKRKSASERALVSEEHIGKPKLGGPWTLYDAKTGRPFSSDDLKGKFQLLYFGFTYCPDICPEELEKQKAVIEEIDKEFPGIVQPVFITVDPKRDTLAQTASYVKEFHPRLIGLTGAPNQVKRVTRLFRVYYNEGIKTMSTDGDEDYLVDHSIIHYLMGPDNEFVDFYGKNLNIDEMATKLKKTIRDYRTSQNSNLMKKL